MKLNIFFLLLSFSSVIFFPACSNFGEKLANQKEIAFNDARKNQEISLNDSSLQKSSVQVSTDKENSQAFKRQLPDNSEVEILFDGFGNKTETRTFKDHQRLRFIIVRTAVDGTKTITVYGYGNNTKTLDDWDIDGINSSADEIANAAKFYETKKSNEPPPNFLKKKTKPLSSPDFPAQQQSTVVEETQSETNENNSPEKPK